MQKVQKKILVRNVKKKSLKVSDGKNFEFNQQKQQIFKTYILMIQMSPTMMILIRIMIMELIDQRCLIQVQITPNNSTIETRF